MNTKSNSTKNRLLSLYDSNYVGVWEIHGEDSNADLAGSHYCPLLDTVYGHYKNVVEYALTLKDFFTWGYGGAIKLKKKKNIKLKNVDLIFSEKLIEEKKKLQKRLNEIDKELSWTS